MGLSGLQYHAVLLGGEKQGAGLGQHAAGVCMCVCVSKVGGGHGADVVLWQEEGRG